MRRLLVILGLLLSVNEHIQASDTPDNETSHEYFYEYYEDDEQPGSEVLTNKFKQYLKDIMLKNHTTYEGQIKSKYNHKATHHHGHQSGNKHANYKHGWPKGNITLIHRIKPTIIGIGVSNSTETSNYNNRFNDNVKRSEYLETLHNNTKSNINHLSPSINDIAKQKSFKTSDISKTQQSFLVNPGNTIRGSSESEKTNYFNILPKPVKSVQTTLNNSILGLSTNKHDSVVKETENNLSKVLFNTSKASSNILNSNETTNKDNQFFENVYEGQLNSSESGSNPLKELQNPGAIESSNQNSFNRSDVSRIQYGLPFINKEEKFISTLSPQKIPNDFNNQLDSTINKHQLVNVVTKRIIKTIPDKREGINIHYTTLPTKILYLNGKDKIPISEDSSLEHHQIVKQNNAAAIIHPFRNRKTHIVTSSTKIIKQQPSLQMNSNPTNALDSKKVLLHSGSIVGAEGTYKNISNDSENDHISSNLTDLNRLINEKEINLSTESSITKYYKGPSITINNALTNSNYSQDKVIKKSINNNTIISFLPKPLIENYNNNLQLLKYKLKQIVSNKQDIAEPSLNTNTELEEREDDLKPNNVNDNNQLNVPSFILDKKHENKTDNGLPVYSNKPIGQIGSHVNLTSLVSSIVKDIKPVFGGKYIYVPSTLTLITDTTGFNYSEPLDFNVLLNHIIRVITRNIYGKTIKRRKVKRPRKKGCKNSTTGNKTMEPEIISNSNKYETGASVVYDRGLVESGSQNNDNNSAVLILDDIKDLGDGNYTLIPSSVFSLNDTTLFNYTSPHPLEEILDHLAHTIYTNTKKRKTKKRKIRRTKQDKVQGDKSTLEGSKVTVENDKRLIRDNESEVNNGSVKHEAINTGGSKIDENKGTKYTIQSKGVSEGDGIQSSANKPGGNYHPLQEGVPAKSTNHEYSLQFNNINSLILNISLSESNNTNKTNKGSSQNPLKTIPNHKIEEAKLNSINPNISHLENISITKVHKNCKDCTQNTQEAFPNGKTSKSASVIYNAEQQNIVNNNSGGLISNTTEKTSNFQKESQRFTGHLLNHSLPETKNKTDHVKPLAVHQQLSATKGIDVTVQLQNKGEYNHPSPGTFECIIENINANVIDNVNTNKDEHQDKTQPSKKCIIRVIIQNNTTKDFAVDITSNNTIVLINILYQHKKNTTDSKKKSSEQNQTVVSNSQTTSNKRTNQGVEEKSLVPKENRDKTKHSSHQNTEYVKNLDDDFSENNLTQEDGVNNTTTSINAQPLIKLKKVVKIFNKKTVEEKKTIETFT